MKKQVDLFVEKVLFCLEQPFAIQDHEITITGSIGVGYGQAADDVVDITLKNAEIAMQKARERR
ncbi:diguanylate cyclase (plasmid) [Acaryochloris sp. 'Moss Beach']|uniref:diguanylate cyclase n=1 Tax=Acaryochloris sp. 'Moss Beach' TaxID=2740837 RepID=UPI001F17A225|nr:diguanylate cyclase [Acaryochloris sp. 'Moss Beach']UJB72460.1 diguanylate cyclase [Acaryochloris sp. 'Moss Beach']